MSARFRVRQLLRDATADWHQRVDDIFSRADLGDREGYGRFLTAQAAAHDGVEAALDRGGAATVLPDWPQRRRSALLHADLAALGLEPPVPLELPAFAGTAELLGGIYVLEGSRLGGALLRRSVPADLPATFLGAGDSAGWRQLLDMLDQRLQNKDEAEAAIEAARRAFKQFERSGIRYLGVE